ncbi:TM0106 family RecB-like putative nuclease [Sphingomonas jaspsi]|uniref:TM0106 family RecB-like putative nuclease n=1 Tax=Sphingomonas jaspsi TaxID=392409 RepID=UPI0004AC8C8B|nr:TM0106 family RecB-like putative nuclease [Sphingomonas jaspsi]
MPIVTAAHLYDLVACSHRVHLDQFGDPSDRDEISPFVQLLWERGTSYEAEVVGRLKEGEFVSVRELPPSDREAATISAMKNGIPLIYGGRIAAGDLLGEPDLLIKRDGGYIAADIKSGRGEEGDPDEDDGKLKPHYAVQVALYTDILLQLGFGIGHHAEIWDVKGDHVPYDLDSPRHSRTTETWWDVYVGALGSVRAILGGSPTRGALASACKLCHWYSFCRGELTAAGDLTLIPYLGRALRDGMSDHLTSLSDFAACDPEAFIDGSKTSIPRLGADRLRLFHRRARLLTESGAAPFLRDVVELPPVELEIFFDIEADPMNDIVYLHGFVERRNQDPATETFTAFFAETNDAEGEREAFRNAMAWLKDRPDAAVYYYSKYERTMYRKLCARYPDVCSADDVEALFTPPRSVDLYFDVVFRATEWPTNDHSIKTLAKFLGFAWRDTDPSGAASIEWYQRFVESGDHAIKQRILDYNEDDCRATAVLLDGIRRLAV